MGFFICALLFLGPSFAQEEKVYPTETLEVLPGETPPTGPSKVEAAVEEAKPFPEKVEEWNSKLLRANSFGTVMVGYQFLSTWIPSKKVLSYTQNFNEKWSAEFEYSWSSLDVPNFGVDLGEISEKRYSLFAKRFVGNSFHFDFGPYLYNTKAHAGASLLNQGVQIGSFSVEGVGASFGMGNRWLWKNGMTLGIDWLRIHIPLHDTKINNSIRKDLSNKDDSDDVNDAIDTLSNIPTFVILGLKLGYTF